MLRILFVCLGNICRSPMAEFIMKDLLRQNGLHAECASAAVSWEEAGNPIYPPAKRKLSEEGITFGHHTARVVSPLDYTRYDLILGMDDANIRALQRIFGGDPERKIHKLLSLCGESGNVADPWYTGNFDAAYQDIFRGCEALLPLVRQAEENEP